MKIKKILATILIVSIVLFGTPAFGLLDDNSTNQNQGQGQQQGIDSDIDNSQGQQQGQGQGQAQGQGQGQDQGQAQAAISAQAQGQANLQGTKVEVGGDKITTYIMEAPSTRAEKGQSAASGYSLFGGLNLAETEEGEKCIEVIRAVSQAEAAKLITHERAVEIANEMINQLVVTTRPKRILGVLWKTNGRHLFNLFGVLSTDDAFAALEDMADVAAARKAAKKIIEEINE